MESGTTGIDWDRYEPYDPGVSDSPRNMQRVEARRLFNASMEAKPERLEFLGQLLKANGLELTSGDEGHSEARILQRIVDEGYSPSQITHLYSDRALSSGCSGLMRSLAPGATISYAVPYGPSAAERRGSTRLLQFLIGQARSAVQ